MMFRSQLAALGCALIFAGSVFASPKTTCPSIDDIKSEGLSRAEQIGPDMYLGYNISDYNTSENWGFMIAPIEAESSDEAIDAGNDILSEMSAPGVLGEDGSVCTYNTGYENIIAAAIKDDTQISPMTLKHYFQKTH